MRIKIIGKERLIAFNGQDGVACPKGSTHDVPDELGASLVRDKWATEIAAAQTSEDDTKPAADDAAQAAPTAGPSETKVVEPGEAK